MKTIVKLLLILAVILGLSISILYYAKSQVAPPSDVAFTNYHVKEINEQIRTLCNESDAKLIEVKYHTINSMIQTFVYNNYLTDGEKTEACKLFIESYHPKYTEVVDAKFCRAWTPNDIESIENRLKEVNGFGVELDYTHKAKQEAIYGVINSYRNTISAANSAKFKSRESIAADVSALRSRKNDRTLSNCAALVNSVDRAISRIERGHYSYIGMLVAKLKDYQSKSSTEFDALYDRANKELAAYNGLAQRYYGSSQSNTSSLSVAMADYQTAARQYYRAYNKKNRW